MKFISDGAQDLYQNDTCMEAIIPIHVTLISILLYLLKLIMAEVFVVIVDAREKTFTILKFISQPNFNAPVKLLSGLLGRSANLASSNMT